MAGVRAVDMEYKPTPELAAVIGKGTFTRGNVMKRLWKYIKSNDLQRKDDKRVVKADKLLKPIFGTSELNMFKMTAKVSKHLKKV